MKFFKPQYQDSVLPEDENELNIFDDDNAYLGRFYLDKDFVANNPNLIQKLFKNVILLKVLYSPDENTFIYVGWSKEYFDLYEHKTPYSQKGYIGIPIYTIKYDKHNDCFKSFCTKSNLGDEICGETFTFRQRIEELSGNTFDEFLNTDDGDVPQ